MTGIYLFNSKREPTEIEHLTEEEFIQTFSAKDDAIPFLYGVMQRIVELEEILIRLGFYDTASRDERINEDSTER